MTVSSFNTVSQNPPLVLWSIDNTALSLDTFTQAEYFVVNVLARDQSDVANQFARRSEDKFTDTDYSNGGITACPVLKGTAACLECKTWSVYDGGDHQIIVGEVLKYSYSDQTTPLVFSQSGYAVPVRHPTTPQTQTDFVSSDGFLDNYLLYLLRATHILYSADLYRLLFEECGVNPEEWRVMTILFDYRKISVEGIAAMTSRPLEECRDTLDAMQTAGYLTVDESSIVRPTDQGLELAERLIDTATQHEKTLTGSLDEAQLIALKDSLKGMLGLFRHLVSIA